MTKKLIAYFSRADENFFGGAIRYIEVGNTEIVVNKIAEMIEADLYKVDMGKAIDPEMVDRDYH
ncbi:hypothetical protein [Peptostreptococcus porci]|uniref:hypothetical protein n=1 Tax=Peptostreptococcus porci TaxID=2652282 RepID=UPI002A9196FE|nr:hypothetical protein [Peptostreptococcus porci]MDY5436687.1 hypothetical protein [Peptostreptococcus porci]